jgi:hypothetical protein
MSSRSEALAARIEEGANGLAAFADGLSDAEWTTLVPGGSGRDTRAVGVAVHHVASVYPVEIDLAKAIGAGNPVDVTWDAVADMNAKHAQENAKVSKADAIALLKKNSKAAADAVRSFTDEQLDTAAPFGLSFGAPVTAQFVLEDHAVRHSWHHLARIKSALGK